MTPGQRTIAIDFLAGEIARTRHHAQVNAQMALGDETILESCDKELQRAEALEATLELLQHYRASADTQRIEVVS